MKTSAVSRALKSSHVFIRSLLGAFLPKIWRHLRSIYEKSHIDFSSTSNKFGIIFEMMHIKRAVVCVFTLQTLVNTVSISTTNITTNQPFWSEWNTVLYASWAYANVNLCHFCMTAGHEWIERHGWTDEWPHKWTNQWNEYYNPLADKGLNMEPKWILLDILAFWVWWYQSKGVILKEMFSIINPKSLVLIRIILVWHFAAITYTKLHLMLLLRIFTFLSLKFSMTPKQWWLWFIYLSMP